MQWSRVENAGGVGEESIPFKKDENKKIEYFYERVISEAESGGKQMVEGFEVAVRVQGKKINERKQKDIGSHISPKFSKIYQRESQGHQNLFGEDRDE